MMWRRRILDLLCAAVLLALLAFLVYTSRQRTTEAAGATAVEQIDPQHPCGAVCVTVVSELLGRPVELQRVKELVRTDGLGRTSMEELQDGLRCQGFSALGVRLSPGTLKDLAGVPLILFVNRSHFLVALPTGVGTAVILDPPHPAACWTADALGQRWGGEAILVQNSPEELQRVLAALGIADAYVTDLPGRSK
jgi:ABC-type bacteriocin/lantibiotic exporter with double-glycine peptidase domain